MRRFNTLLFLPFVLAFGLFSSEIAPQSALAAAPSTKGFTVSPAFQSVDVSADQQNVSFTVTITNTTNQPQTLHLSTLDFGGLNETGGLAFIGLGKDKVERKYGLASWLHLDKDVMVVDAGGSNTVNATIENRESLAPGGHYGAILFTAESDPSESGNTVAINQSFSTLIFAKKLGGEIYSLDLKNHNLPTTAFSLPSKVILRFQNKGNVHAVPRGKISIINPFGQAVATGVINPDSSIILPESYRQYGVILKRLMPITVPGPYKVKIDYRYDGKDEFATTESKLQLLDPTILVVLLVISGAIYVGAAQLNRRRRSRRVARKK